MDVTQPNGNVDLIVTHSKGSRIGNGYFSPFTFTQGAFPNGWFYGLDITLFDIVTLYNTQYPTIVGNLDPCVSRSFTWVGGVPGGLDFYLTSIELQDAIIRNQITPFQYTTVP